MLKRILLILTCLVVLAAALAVPLRREYSIINDTATGTADQLTSVHYGTPVTWLVLSKQVDTRDPQNVKKQSRSYDYKALALDIVSWGAAIAFIAWLSRATNKPLFLTIQGKRTKI
jgi:hypothetical protein